MKNDADGKIISREEFGKGNLKKISDCLSKTFDKGNVLVVFDEKSSNVSDDVVRYLLKGGYFVRTAETHGKAEELPAVDECVKYIVGVGGGGVADDARLLAKRQSVGYSIVITAPDNDNFASDGAYIMNEYVYTGAPDFVLIDEEIVEKSTGATAAAGYGRAFSCLVGLFDADFKKLMFARDFDESAVNTVAESIKIFESKKNDDNFKTRLARLMFTISKAKNNLDMKAESADAVARVMTEKFGRTFGENSFLAAYMILNVYRLYLESDATDTLIPEDIVLTLKTLEKMRVVNYNNYMSDLSVTTATDYLKQTFILSEYRREMYERLDGMDLPAVAKFWRRLYDDAGFWLKRYASSDELFKVMALASELSEGGLLKYVKRTGFFERFI